MSRVRTSRKWFTPVLGFTLGVALLLLGFGIVAWAKKLLPDEVSVQERHHGPSAHDDQVLTRRHWATWRRRPASSGGRCSSARCCCRPARSAWPRVTPLVGALVRSPNDPEAVLLATGWSPSNNGGKKVRLTREDGSPVRPEDVSVGGQITVFPGIPGGASNTYADSPTLLFHLREEDARKLEANIKKTPPKDNPVEGMWQNFVAYSKICTHAGCPASLYEQQTNRLLCPCHQSQFLITDQARPIFGPGAPTAADAADRSRGRIPRRGVGLHRGHRAGLLGAPIRTKTTAPRRRRLAGLPARSARQVDERYQLATPLRRIFNKVFPDHWSFLLGEIALYLVHRAAAHRRVPFALLRPVDERGRATTAATRRCAGIEMSKAYETSLNLSFDVRGGLIMRQMHHWAALLFMAAIVVHMFRVFFTGAFRKPRELNWIIGVSLFWLGFTEGFAGYSLPDDALSGTGLRIASAIMLSIPVIGIVGDEFAVRWGVPGHGDPAPALHRARAADPRHSAGAHHRAHGSAGQAEAHPVAGPGTDQQQRGRRAHVPRFRGQGRRLLHDRLRCRRADGWPVPDQPDLALRPVQGGGRLGGEPARLVRHVPRRLDPPLPGVGHHRRRLHHSRRLLAHGRAARHPEHAADDLSVHRGAVAQGPPGTPPARSVPATPRPAPRSARWRSASTWC